MPLSSYFAESIDTFRRLSPEHILGELSNKSRQRQAEVTNSQIYAWDDSIRFLQQALIDINGHIHFELSIPRMGTRADCVLLVGDVIFVIEFKVGADEIHRSDLEQVWDYALDLKNFHETSHLLRIVPILCLSEVGIEDNQILDLSKLDHDGVAPPFITSPRNLRHVLTELCTLLAPNVINHNTWAHGAYKPTPTIIEAATSLYNRHTVEDITRSDASAHNLSITSRKIQNIIHSSRTNHHKSIIFVTGVPGAGKTLVGLNVATTNLDPKSATHSVFLSGNGPLVSILREALALDYIRHHRERKKKILKKDAERPIKAFIQNVHHYRDEYLRDQNPPSDRVAIFDEAQRAWNLEMTSDFMKRKKGRRNFDQSEPQFLISCLDRHVDWAVIVCLVGGGQEINRGEAGISEWLNAIRKHYPKWHVHISDRLGDSEYAAGHALELLANHHHVSHHPELHLRVSMRSFRAEHVSQFVKELLDLNLNSAKQTYTTISKHYPIVLTRSVEAAKNWLRSQARGSERYGLIASSQAERLRPLTIDVKRLANPIHWFLKGKDDVRSSFYLEDTVTEFQVQGLEVDWACITWDADMRFSRKSWQHFQFRGSKWQRINKIEGQIYQKNAYRVLLTRARQGMVIVVPEGDPNDPTRLPEFYDPIFEYLKGIGIQILK